MNHDLYDNDKNCDEDGGDALCKIWIDIESPRTHTDAQPCPSLTLEIQKEFETNAKVAWNKMQKGLKQMQKEIDTNMNGDGRKFNWDLDLIYMYRISGKYH